MSELHPTITDKDRGTDGLIGLIEDGDYHWLSIFDERDGLVKRAVIVPDGTYIVEGMVGGKILSLGPTDPDFVLVRYHFKSTIANPTGQNGEFDQGEVGEKYHDVTGGGLCPCRAGSAGGSARSAGRSPCEQARRARRRRTPSASTTASRAAATPGTR